MVRSRYSVLRLLSVATAAVAFATTVGAQSIPRIPFEKYTLPNGLEVILHQDHTTPMIAVDTWYHVGSGDEKPGHTGFAHLFEHLMFMGSQHVPTGQFDQLLEAAGANNNGSTTEDRTNYYETMPSNALPLALYLDSDRMGFLLPALDSAKVDLQRDVVKNERRQRVDNVPYGKSDETILAALYPKGHPYSWPVIGSMADLSAATLTDVKNFFRTYYAPNNATLVIAGDFNVDSAKALVKHYFGDIPRGPQIPSRPSPAPVVIPRDTFLVLQDRVQLPRVYYTWPSVKNFAHDDAALNVLASVLADGKNSRLYKRLVYDMQIAQDVNAYQNGEHLAGYFQIIVTPRKGIAPARIDSLVREELIKLQKDGITARELARVQNSTRSDFLRSLATDLGKAELLNQYNYFVGDPDYVQRDAARYDAVTRADVQRVARMYLGKPKVVLTVVPDGMTALMVKGGSR
ncbi:MAG TPA: pitrilysin family protein [Gemmatimonadaceae bacterium]|nr:pitrilysin family protein [Gemmatimonadaceae bacterium]